MSGGVTSDPVPAITEAAATGEIASIYADIRRVLGVDVVNLIWRHLATIDGALPWAWGTLRPLYADGLVITEATVLHRALALPPVPAVPAEVFAGLGLEPNDLTAIREVLAAYDRTNAMALVALTALRARLDGRAPSDAEAAEPAALAAAPPIGLPRLLNLTEMPAYTAALVTLLNGLGTQCPGPVLASMYRHLAHWPSYLSFAWLSLAPLDTDGQLAIAIDAAQDAARTRGPPSGSAGCFGDPTAASALAAAIGVAIEPFVGDVIARMVVICAFLRRATESAAG